MTKPLERTLLVDHVARHLRDDILSGALGPGTRILVGPICKQLGVSHIPMREAIRRLEAESLVVTVPHQGTVVAQVRLEELAEIYNLRRLIEGHVVAEAGQRYTTDDLTAINETMQRLLDADPEDPDGTFWNAHRSFHWALLRPALGPWHQRILGLLWQSAERYHRLFTLVFGSLEDAHLEHRLLAEAARDRDVERLQ
ncbi:MAG: GntR family transcriptional regulator, partial [Acidimicrobiia bacterium]